MTSKLEIQNKFLFNQLLEVNLEVGNEIQTCDDVDIGEWAMDCAVETMEIRKFEVFVCREKFGGNWDVFENRYLIAGSKSPYSEAEYVREYLSSDYAGKYSEIAMKRIVDFQTKQTKAA